MGLQFELKFLMEGTLKKKQISIYLFFKDLDPGCNINFFQTNAFAHNNINTPGWW